jgi:DNA-damage-inducible protein D
MSGFTIEEFENSSHENGSRYWEARQFMQALGYETWSAFQSVITKAMGSCAKMNIDPTEAFRPFVLFDQDGKELRTYKLNRFACFLITMQADAKKPQVMQARLVLAAIADHLIEARIREDDIGRIETREDLKLAERIMSGVASEQGLESQQFGIFKDAGFRGMYNMSLRELTLRKGVGQKSVLYDFMGLEELSANLFRVTQTASRIKNTGVRGLPALSKTAKEVGSEVRRVMMKDKGKPPESLPVAEDIKNVQKRIKGVEREMKKLDRAKDAH